MKPAIKPTSLLKRGILSQSAALRAASALALVLALSACLLTARSLQQGARADGNNADSILVNALPGDLDLTFGVDGTVATDLGNNLYDTAFGAAVQADGKVVTVGVIPNSATGQDFAVTRLNPNGSLDTTFSDDGRLTFDFDMTSRSDAARAVVIQPDGKIVIAGEANTASFGYNVALARLNADGSFDTTFGSGGKVSTNLPNNRNDYGRAAALQPDGKILVAGYSNRTTTGDDFIALRYNTNGTLDTSFDMDGFVTTDMLTNREDRAASLVVQSDGKIVIAGYTNDALNRNDFAIVRYNSDGSLDPGLNATGKAITDLNLTSDDIGNAVAIQSDGKIVVAGQSAADFGLIRYNPSGSLDTGFGGGDGIVTTNFGTNATDIGRAVIVQSTGKIIVAGRSRSELACARYNADGTLDTSFNFDGLLLQNSSLGGGGYWAMIQQPDGKLVAAGECWRDSFGGDFAVSRINADGTFDFSFDGGDAIAITDINGRYDTANSVAVQPDGKIVAAGYAQNSTGGNDFAVARYNPNGTLDTSFDGDGIAITDIHGTPDDYAFAVAVQPDGKIVVAGQTDNAGDGNLDDGALVRYNANGTLDSSFGTGGISITPGSAVQATGLTWLRPYSIALQPNGKIVVTGQAAHFSINRDGFVARYNSNGTLDNSFGSGPVGGPFSGSIALNFNTSDSLNAVALQADGKIVVAGQADNGTSSGTSDFVLARLTANGVLDTSFDVDGKVSTNFTNGAYDAANDVVIQPDGKIIAAGTTSAGATSDDYAVARYNPDGSLDLTFGGGDGLLNADFFNQGDNCRAMALQPDGKIILAGGFNRPTFVSGYALLKLNPNGTLDQSFGGGDGKVTTTLAEGVASGLDQYLADVAVQPNGQIVAAGRAYFSDSANRDFVVVRYRNTPRTAFDFDGDGKSDVSAFRPGSGAWYLLNSTQGFASYQFGIGIDKLVPADYDGDGKTDVAVFRDGLWYLLRSQQGFAGIQFGSAGDIPAPADYDGDGRAELTVYRGGYWYVLNIATNQFQAVQFGVSTDKPVPADYDGDGKTDFAVYRDGTWYLLRSALGFTAVQFGLATDKPTVGDFDGDGKADPAVYRSGTWYLLRTQLGFTSMQFGVATDIPAAADYDGDTKTDLAVFRDGTWYLMRSTQGFTAVQFGAASDKPIPASYVP